MVLQSSLVLPSYQTLSPLCCGESLNVSCLSKFFCVFLPSVVLMLCSYSRVDENQTWQPAQQNTPFGISGCLLAVQQTCISGYKASHISRLKTSLDLVPNPTPPSRSHPKPFVTALRHPSSIRRSKRRPYTNLLVPPAQVCYPVSDTGLPCHANSIFKLAVMLQRRSSFIAPYGDDELFLGLLSF